ncbi:hypothetical protein NKG05_19665 [Oerskovia sp. M15]
MDRRAAYLQHATVLRPASRRRLHRQPRPAQALRVPGRRSPGRGDPCGGVPRRKGPRVTTAEPADFPQVVLSALTRPVSTDIYQDDEIPTWGEQGRAMRDVIENARRLAATRH